MQANSIYTGALVLAVVMGIGCRAQATESGVPQNSLIQVDIPAESLADALNALAVEANLQILFEQKPVAGIRSSALKGQMTHREALRALLARTNLYFIENSDGTVLIRTRAHAVPKTTTATASIAPSATAPEPSAAEPAVAPPKEIESPWLVRTRAVFLQPRGVSDGFTLPGTSHAAVLPADSLDLNGRIAPEIDGEFFFTPRWSTELALNWPQIHSLRLSRSLGAYARGDDRTLRLMPDTLLLKFNLAPDSASIRPYIGAGYALTSFYGLNTTPIDLSNRVGAPAAQVGFDVPLSSHWILNADVKWIRARAAIDFRGESLGQLKPDPWLYGLGVGYRFGRVESAPVPIRAAAAVPASAATPLPPMDSDGDGIPDSLDQCPNTPAGVQVDSVGCPVDSDHDGVPDYLDKCPGTPPGVKVDSNGCEIEEIVLKGVNFETDSAQLTPESDAVLDSIVSALRQRPQTRADIRGYTDARGSGQYNLHLSERRAQAVVDYLAQQGISRQQLSAQGMGKEHPVASNETASGRAQNRRVTLEFRQLVPR
jgi:outer membrane protein OmpA-like peptidoglycan-associated protein/outer membrane protein W